MVIKLRLKYTKIKRNVEHIKNKLFTKNVIVIDHFGVNQRTYCDHCDAKNLFLQENIVEKIWIENNPIF